MIKTEPHGEESPQSYGVIVLPHISPPSLFDKDVLRLCLWEDVVSPRAAHTKPMVYPCLQWWGEAQNQGCPLSEGSQCMPCLAKMHTGAPECLSQFFQCFLWFTINIHTSVKKALVFKSYTGIFLEINFKYQNDHGDKFGGAIFTQ